MGKSVGEGEFREAVGEIPELMELYHKIKNKIEKIKRIKRMFIYLMYH